MLPRDPQEAELLQRLRAGDEAAFVELVDDLHGRLVGFARTFTASPALAEDIVQETWVAVIRGLPKFEGRSSLSTWIYSILVRRARSMAGREARRAQLLATRNGSASERPGVEWELGSGRTGLWEDAPIPWGLEDPSALLETREVLEVLERAVAELPPRQRQVVLLRDVEDAGPEEVCNILGITETNQRVLLHRGRARIRRALDEFIRDDGRPGIPRAAGPQSVSTPGIGSSPRKTLRQSRSRA